MSGPRVRGRWRLERLDNPGAGCFTVALGDFPPAGLSIPVVPCDDEAVERVAIELFARSFTRRPSDRQLAVMWEDGNGWETWQEQARDEARGILRVAGGR